MPFDPSTATFDGAPPAAPVAEGFDPSSAQFSPAKNAEFDPSTAHFEERDPNEATLSAAPEEGWLHSAYRTFREAISPIVGKTPLQQAKADQEKRNLARQFPGMAEQAEAGGSDVEKKGLSGALFGIKTPWSLPTNDEPVREKSNAYFEALLAPKEASDPKSLKVAKALYTPIAHTLNAMTSPVGLGTMGLSAAGEAVSATRSGVSLGSDLLGPSAVGGESAPVVHALEGSVAAIFASDMGRSLAESAPDLVAKIKDPNADFQDKLQASVEFSLNAAFVGLAGRGAYTAIKPESLAGKTQTQKVDLLAQASGKSHEEVIKEVQDNFDELLGNVGKPESVLAQEKRRADLQAEFAARANEQPTAVAEKLPRDDSQWRYEILNTRTKEGNRAVNVTRVNPDGSRGESRPLEAWLAEGHDIPEVPENHPRGNFSAEEVSQNAKTAEDFQKTQDEEQLQLALDKLPEEARSHPAYGLGAATAEEMTPKPSVTGIKNADIDADRVKRGLPPLMDTARRSWGKVWDQAMQRIDSAAMDGEDAASEIIARQLDKPESLSDVEQAILLHRRIDLKNQYDRVASRLVEGHEIGSEVTLASDRLRLAQLEDQLQELEQANKVGGAESGRGLAARKMMAREDFSLANMRLRKRANKGGAPLTEAEGAQVEAAHKKIVEAQKELDLHTKGGADAESEAAAEDAIEQMAKDAESEPPEQAKNFDLDKERDRAIANIRKRVEDDAPPEDLTAFIRKLAENFVRRGVKERNALVDAVHGVIKDVAPEMDRRQVMDAISGYGDFKPLDQDAVKAQLRDLKGQMQQVAKLEDMQKGQAPAKTGVERRTPSDEERRLIKEVNEMKRKGGFNVTDPAKQLKSALDGIKTRLTNQIADLTHQIETRTRIVKTRTAVTLDAAAEALTKQRDALQEQFNQIFQKPELTDAQRLAMAEKMADRQIAELERQIRTQEVFPAGKSPELKSAALDAKRARIEALKEERQYLRDSINPKTRKTPDEMQLSALKTRLKNRTAELQERLANSDFGPRPKKAPVQLDAEAERLQAAATRAKQEFDTALLKDRLENRPILKKMKDTFVKWQRGFLLSGPVTLAKLTAAAVTRMGSSLVEEGIGAGISKIIPEVAKRAPREGGLSIKAEAKSISSALTQGMRDAWQTLTTGKSDLDVNYGKGKDGAVRESDILPRTMIDFFGALHGALKAPVKRAEFERSLQKRIESYLANNADLSDPAVQVKAMLETFKQEAYKDASRSIFLQDNILAEGVNSFIGRLEQPLKATGKPSPAGTVAAGVARGLFPIVRVPLNIVAETVQYATGLYTGSGRLGLAFRRGIENLSPEQADLIMRDLKKGVIGTAALVLGHLNADQVGGYYTGEKPKRTDAKFGTIKILGANIPSFLLHSPLLEALQIGATIRHVMDKKIRGADQSLGSAVWMSALGLAEETPFGRGASTVARLLDPRETAKAGGEIAKSTLVPQLVSQTAEALDRDEKGVVPRKAEGPVTAIKSGIPGLRQTLPVDQRKANRR